MNLVTLASGLPGWAYPIIIFGVFGVIVLIVMLLKKYVKPFQNHDKPKSDKEVAAEELERILQPIEEDEAKKQMKDFDPKK